MGIRNYIAFLIAPDKFLDALENGLAATEAAWYGRCPPSGEEPPKLGRICRESERTPREHKIKITAVPVTS